MSAILSTQDVVVRFGVLQAVSQASIEVVEGRVTGLIGPNGAGKTTLFNVITGLQEPTAGKVFFDGKDITNKNPFKRARMGIARTFQKLEVFGSLSARENILVAAEQRKTWDRSGFDPNQVCDEILEKVGLSDVSEFMVGTLPTGTARLVELARALASNPKVLLLDEPSSGLNEEETEEMASLLRKLVDEGLGVLLVEHDMSFVMGTCQFIHVLDFGTIIATGTPAEVQANAQVQAAYLGTETVVEAS
ncbi:MAG: ABC transporter ATP-binding protein [Cyanobium usitatum Tobar12.5m-G36]|jgi:branched-chain amino acid transport system ATP-binding protein|nr:ABC transporter ATP-binding protein [Cyanobium usitatum Tobar12.5m-G36]MCG9476581.1 ABC transporter ATP-binding protein [Actinomycetes bacterium]